MDANPIMTITIGAHTTTITLPDKDTARVLANRLCVAAAGLDDMSAGDKDKCHQFHANIIADINDD